MHFWDVSNFVAPMPLHANKNFIFEHTKQNFVYNKNKIGNANKGNDGQNFNMLHWTFINVEFINLSSYSPNHDLNSNMP